MSYNLEQVPFSMRGSYLAVSLLKENLFDRHNKAGLYLRSVHGLNYVPISTMQRRPVACARIVPLSDGAEVPCEITATEAEVRLTAAQGEIRLCFGDADTLLFQGKGLDMALELVEWNYAYLLGTQAQPRMQLNCQDNGRQMSITAQEGRMALRTQDRPEGCYSNVVNIHTGATGTFFIAVEDIAQERKLVPRQWDYASCLRARQQEFETFLSTLPGAPAKYESARHLAAYQSWSCLVKPAGQLPRESMLMAKNWMCNVWSWDHCFNAIAMCYDKPELAWDQLMGMFDCQSDSGRLPDSISDAYIVWNFCKPPIHGWALKKLMQHMVLTPAQQQEAYHRLSRWTQWWLTFRDENGDGLCEYHHGNDSGWDNSTVFRRTPVVSSPDLAAFLIVQMDVLQELADSLGLAAEGQVWAEKSARMFEAMMTYCFSDTTPQAVAYADHAPQPCDSLLVYMPLLLGDRLPENIRQRMIADLKSDRFLTAHGLATEAVDSPYYLADGYWRGPIWAPSTMLLIDGLASCGEKAFATTLAERFCDMAVQSGFAENYDALTGEGLRDRAYPWTSSVFLILLKEYIAH